MPATRTPYYVDITTIAPPQDNDHPYKVVAVEEIMRYYFESYEQASAFADEWTALYKGCSPVVSLHLP